MIRCDLDALCPVHTDPLSIYGRAILLVFHPFLPIPFIEYGGLPGSIAAMRSSYVGQDRSLDFLPAIENLIHDRTPLAAMATPS